MTSEAISLFYDEPAPNPPPPRERSGPGLDLAHPYADHRGPSAPRAPAPEQERTTHAHDFRPGELAAWTDFAGGQHVGRVEKADGATITVAYGPTPHRLTIRAGELRPVADRDGQGRHR